MFDHKNLVYLPVMSNPDIQIVVDIDTKDVKVQFSRGFVWGSAFQRAFRQAEDMREFESGPVKITTFIFKNSDDKRRVRMEVEIEQSDVELDLTSRTCNEIMRLLRAAEVLVHDTYGLQESEDADLDDELDMEDVVDEDEDDEPSIHEPSVSPPPSSKNGAAKTTPFRS